MPKQHIEILNHRALGILAMISATPGLPPTYLEIGEAGAGTCNNVHQHLARLNRLGLLTFAKGQARTAVSTCRIIPLSELDRQT